MKWYISCLAKKSTEEAKKIAIQSNDVPPANATWEDLNATYRNLVEWETDDFDNVLLLTTTIIGHPVNNMIVIVFRSIVMHSLEFTPVGFTILCQCVR